MTAARRDRLVGVLGAVLMGLCATACPDPPGTVLALASFNEDAADASPNMTLPGDPVGDELRVSGDPQRVRAGSVFSSKYLEFMRGNLNTSVQLLAATSTAGRYKMSVSGAVLVAQVPVRIRFVAGTGGEVSLSFASAGRIVALSGQTSTDVGSFQAGTPHTVTVDLQHTLGRAVVTVQNGGATTVAQYITLAPSTDARAMIELSYPGTFVEAFPGSYAVDVMSIRGL